MNLHFNNFNQITPILPGQLNEMEYIRKMHFFYISYQFPLIIKILLDSQMYVVTDVEFIFSISSLISCVKNLKQKNESTRPNLLYNKIEYFTI